MQTDDGIRGNSKYKDTLFRFLFGRNKKNALSLYNAVNGSDYTDEDELTFTTLEDVIFIKYKNDVSFLFDKTLTLFEHQSSCNPNMPLRGLLYFADLYRQILPETERLYGSRLIKIPTPRYIVFYNGPKNQMKEDMRILRLSDAFEDDTADSRCEWTATMININAGSNQNLMERCAVLQEYSIFIEKVKTLQNIMSVTDAVRRAVDECIQENVLRDVLTKHKKEVLDMCLTEFDEKKFEEIVREEGRAEGREIEIYTSVRDGDYSVERGAEKLGQSVEQFVERMRACGFLLPGQQ